ncbi:L-serine ammonia-lyase [Salinibacterium sp. ZJ454]|uniref:L-serine ammonia-lyase n=1 Tax=Salinibacterium sp. ZJ454 TaxID=2708339 RepID=UPI001420B3BA|nr:L-serine ammonia-lyase [Salinibacterium sp. ZJ454]
MSGTPATAQAGTDVPDRYEHIGVFDLFKAGIGPSSSHTVGPMLAAAQFAQLVSASGNIDQVQTVQVELFGSLAATGAGHGTFPAILLGLEGFIPETITQDDLEHRATAITASGSLTLNGLRSVACRVDEFVLRPLTIRRRHTNAMTLRARDVRGESLLEETYYSIGGGFIVTESASETADKPTLSPPFPFRTAEELLTACAEHDLSISDVMLANELHTTERSEIREGILRLWRTMIECQQSAVLRSGTLPGALNVRRRAPDLQAHLERQDPERSPQFWQEWVNLVALAVNEENASGGRVVTAPTNGAAGIIPAVLHYAVNYTDQGRAADQDERDGIVERFFLTAAAVGSLFKMNASVSGAEVGCQGEVGSACSMAAAGLAEILGGTPEQVENAAEIAMEHNLGLTCDPIGGLVQIPCIERNAIAAGKAINAAKMALWGDGKHHVSLDAVIATMRETGADMSYKYKETAMGGLAVNVVAC